MVLLKPGSGQGTRGGEQSSERLTQQDSRLVGTSRVIDSENGFECSAPTLLPFSLSASSSILQIPEEMSLTRGKHPLCYKPYPYVILGLPRK